MLIQEVKALVTGGSSGLGKAMAKALIAEGAQVAISGRNKEKLDQVAAELGASAIHFDVADYSALEDAVQKSTELLGGLNLLVNNAGIGEFPLMGEFEVEHFERVFSINVFGLSMLTQEVVKYFRANNIAGHIVNIASTAALKGFPRGSVYAASKFALRGLTQCWQAELRKENIRVMLINPIEVPTAFANLDRIEREEEASKLTPKEIADAMISALKIDDRGFIPELSVWATNPQ
jgi:3-oxoacyl-[acyl-carrier protein] reductase